MNKISEKPYFSIIIPVKEINNYVRETIEHINFQSYSNWEVIIVTNKLEKNEWQHKNIKIIESGIVGPGKKRDQAAKIANGEILVFLDDDSYPDKRILEYAFEHFNNEKIVAVGGPAITPLEDSFFQKVSGAVFLSKWSGGFPERYRPIGSIKLIEDWPTVNLMVRKKEFLEVGGFNTSFWPGEDTKLCLELIVQTGKKIIYDPKMIVWHHRREGLLKHLMQIGAYGLHRGFFVKKYPKTSRKFKFFIPSIFTIFTISSLIILIENKTINTIITSIWWIYVIIMLKALYDIARCENIKIAIASIPYIFLTHIVYGICFIKGLLKKELISKLR